MCVCVPRGSVIARVQELVSHVQALVWLEIEVVLQTQDAHELVADIHPAVIASVEGTKRHSQA